MRLIKPTYKILLQDSGINGIYKAIERAGRLSYKSEDRITDDSAKPFVDKLIKAGHLSCLEHGTVYLRMPISDWGVAYERRLLGSPYVKVVYDDSQGWDSPIYITTNYRVLQEYKYDINLEKYICGETSHHEKRISVHFISSIGIMRELFRHRKMSYIQESSRFCRYSSSKFGGEVTFIQPSWLPEAEDIDNNTYADLCFRQALHDTEDKYLTLLKEGWKPEQAREVLPLCTKAEAIVTGFESDWVHIFKMRTSKATTGKPHPDMITLMDPLATDFTRLFGTIID